MDDWSTIPNHRNAVSEPAPNHQSTLNQLQPGRTRHQRRSRPTRTRAHPAPINIARGQPLKSDRIATATRQVKPPKTLYPPGQPDHDHHQPAPERQNGQPALDFQRSFMDDNAHSISAPQARGVALGRQSRSRVAPDPPTNAIVRRDDRRRMKGATRLVPDPLLDDP
jgi:hypothetical protein